jgi:hypothetical protein
MRLYQGRVKIPVKKCKSPRFRNLHRGRTWDTGTIYIDRVETKVHLDTTWGTSLYFQDATGQWYSFPMFSKFEAKFSGEEYDVDPFNQKNAMLFSFPEYVHPEQKDGEVFLINIKPEEESQFTTNIPDFIESVRVGDVAYKTHSWDVSEGYKPLFGKLKRK